MTDQTSLDQIQALLRDADGSIGPPTVEPLRSVIRSGENFLFGGQAPGVIAAAGAAAPGQAVCNFVGPLVIEWGYAVADDRAAQFRRWLELHESQLSQAAPEGVQYRGTYAVVAQSDLSLGDYRTVWVFASIGATAAMDTACGNGGRFAQLVAELNSFRDRRIGAARSQQIYQPAAHTQRTG